MRVLLLATIIYNIVHIKKQSRKTAQARTAGRRKAHSYTQETENTNKTQPQPRAGVCFFFSLI